MGNRKSLIFHGKTPAEKNIDGRKEVAEDVYKRQDKTREMQEYAKLGTKALGITGYCRLDFMMDQDEKMYCLEANTLPGMTPTSLIPQEAEVLGESYPELCENLIRISLEKYQEQVL